MCTLLETAMTVSVKIAALPVYRVWYGQNTLEKCQKVTESLSQLLDN